MLEGLKPTSRVNAPQGWQPAVVFDGETGEATTPGLVDKPDFDEYLREAGFDPETVEVIGSVRTSRWQRYDGEWLTAYRFRFTTKTNAVTDLPLLWSNAKKKKKPIQVKRNPETAFVIALSDWQIGKTDEGQTSEDTVARIMESFDRIEAQLKRGKYGKILVADVGDIIEGFSNAADMQQLATNDLSLMQQVDVAISLVWEIISRAARYAPVNYISISSNHCQHRINKQRIGRPGQTDWGVMIAQQIHRLATVAEIPVTVSIPQPDDESLAIDVFGDGFHVLGVVHGHQVSRPEQMADWWRKSAFGHQAVAAATTLLHGHWHHLKITELGKSSNGGSRFMIMAKTMDNGSNWWRLTSGEQSSTGTVCFEFRDKEHFQGSVMVL